MKVLIIVAMELELNGFLKNGDYDVTLIEGIKVYQTSKNGHNIYLAKTDVGKVNAACMLTTLILKLKPNYVINAGIGGGLNPSLNLLDVVASTKVAYHDFDLTAFGNKKGEMDNGQLFFKGSLKLLSLLDENVKKGLIVSGDQFISGVDSMKNIKKDFPKALVCDMEGCAVAHTSTLLSRKFLVIRAISDNVFLDDHVKVYTDYKELAVEKVVNVVNNLILRLI